MINNHFNIPAIIHLTINLKQSFSMKKFITIFFLTCLLGSVSYAQVKIGLPAGAPQASAVLDLSNAGDLTRALILPRVTNTASVVTPFNGMLVYDLSSNCTKAYDNGVWSACLSTPAAALGAAVNCNASAINGNYNQGTSLTAANTVTIVVNNNTASALTITTATSDLNLSGTAAAGMSVASVSPASVSPASGGGASTITYTLSGNPTTGGSFTATWTKLGLTCAKTGNVCLTMAPIVVTSTTTPATLPIPTAAGNTIDFVAAGGTPNTSITWAMTSNPATGLFSSPATGTGATAQAILIAGSSGTVTVTFTAVNACGVTLTGTQAVAVSDLSVNNTSSAVNGFYSQNTVLTAANTVTIVLVNNSNVNKTVTPATADLVLSGAGAAGVTVASVSPASVPVAANGGTSTITYTLTGTPTTVGSFTATWTKLGLSTAKTNAVCLAISPISVSSITNPASIISPAVAGNTITYSAVGGTPNSTGVSWVMTSSPAGMFSNSASGSGNTAQAILVAGASGFVTATFSVTNACGLVVTGAQTTFIGGDALRAALSAAGCTSCAAYDAASANNWVNITAAEYAQLDNFIATNIGACNETAMTTTGSVDTPNYTWLSLGSNTSLLPANNYVIAFSTINGNGAASTTGYVKYSTSPTSGFNMSGPILNTSATAAMTRIYFVMKIPSTVINTSAASYVGFYSGTTMSSPNNTLGNINFGTGDVSTLPSTYAQTTRYQVKYTATKKW